MSRMSSLSTPHGDRRTRDAAAWFGGGVVSIAVVAVTAGETVSDGVLFPIVALGAFLAFGIAAIRGVRTHHPFQRFGSGNAVTTVRALLACLLAGIVTEIHPPEYAASSVALLWIAVAFGTICLDGLDGILARRQRMASRFGARFDMEVDAFLLLVLSGLAWTWDKAGVWVLAIGGLRYAFVAAGLVWPPLRAELPRSMRRKTICAVQSVALCVVLLPLVDGHGGAWIAAIALAALCGSFAADTAYLIAIHRRDA